jgi:predicted alpha-1,2-mannosidase
MIGYNSAPVIADAIARGLQGFDYEKAFEALVASAHNPAFGMDSFRRNGLVLADDEHESVSKTLEYAFDDFAVAQLAKALGKNQDYAELMRRSENWRNVINPKTGNCDGRHEPKMITKRKSDGGLFEDNLDFIHRKPFITEGATCHYTWYVPHNVDGLVEALGGPQKFEAKLDSMFTEGRYWHGNEPCHQIAYLYDFIGKREKTIDRVAHILDTEYNDTPGGLSGNDDAGQMSAWYIFSSIGFYPVCPATDRYMLSAPRFQRITLHPDGGRPFVITPNAFPQDRHFITHSEIIGH